MSLFVFDLDGVIYRGNTLLPGVKQTLVTLERKGEKICFLSNNSTLSRRGYRKKLGKMGLNLREDQLFPSSYLCALYFSQQNQTSGKVMIIGEKGLFEELKAIGLRISWVPSEVKWVVVGLDRKLTFRKLSLAYQAIIKGAHFIATNTDVTYPLEETTIPAAGAIVKAIEVSTGKAPLVLGKPETFGLKIVLKRAGYSPSQTVLVGDRLETDITAGNKLGINTVLVLSGISSLEQVKKAPPCAKPRYIISNLEELLSLKFTGSDPDI